MKEKIIELIYQTIDELNEQDEQEQKLEKSLNTVLLGKGSKLDSLGLVNLIVSVEQNIIDTLGYNITLADERALTQEISPFSSIESLANYIEILSKEEGSND